MKKIVFPNSLHTIEKESFSYCTNLSSLKLNDGLIEIGSEAFTMCNKLSKVFIPDTVEILGTDIFRNCANYFTIIMHNNGKVKEYANKFGIRVLTQ